MWENPGKLQSRQKRSVTAHLLLIIIKVFPNPPSDVSATGKI